MNPNCENCAAAPECPTACAFGSIYCTMKRLQSGQTKGRATGGLSLKDTDDLRKYRALGPPSDLIRPVRCGECRYYCEYDDWSRKHLEFYKARYCTYLKKDLGLDGYCSAGERRQSE